MGTAKKGSRTKPQAPALRGEAVRRNQNSAVEGDQKRDVSEKPAEDVYRRGHHGLFQILPRGPQRWEPRRVIRARFECQGPSTRRTREGASLVAL